MVTDAVIDTVEPDGDGRKVVQAGRFHPFDVPRYSPIQEGQKILVDGDSAFVECRNGLARVLPSFRYDVAPSPDWPTAVIKEITTPEEEAGYRRLSEYHYRGKPLYGVHAPLVAVVDHPLWPRVVGYIDLCSDSMMNGARNRILNAPFAAPNGLGWTTWDFASMVERINLIVRIARVVVVPEIRGSGLGHELVRAAGDYAREHWHLGGVKPYFLIIVADMLKHVPFAARGGMYFIGETHGNLDEFAQDAKASERTLDILRYRKALGELGTRGILGIRLRDAEAFRRVAEEKGWTPEQAQRFADVSDGVSPEQYAAFAEHLRFPKPVYFRGLTHEAETFVAARLAALRIPDPPFVPPPTPAPLSGSIVVRNANLSIRSDVPMTERTRDVEQAFGLKPDELEESVVRGLSVDIAPGSATLITGPSGSGKSVLLALLMGSTRPDSFRFEGDLDVPADARFGVLERLDPDTPLVEQFPGSTRTALYYLNLAGLTDAHAYLKRFRDLSAGQQYRAMVARLIASGSNVWVADEFCSTLDPITARIVGGSVRKVARKFGATLLVAAPHSSAFLASFAPDQVIAFVPGRDVRVWSGADYLAATGVPPSGRPIPVDDPVPIVPADNGLEDW